MLDSNNLAIMWSILVLSVLFFQNGLGDLIVQLPNGKINGTTIDTPSGQTFYAWRGIPLAQPPIGKLRYLPPVKAEPWDGILDASKDSPACIAFGSFSNDPIPLNGRSEDCLYINVYSPVSVGSSSNVNSTRTVLVWIYGGGFFTGFSDFSFYDPTPFLEEDVIVVTFNYRLGTFGFLSTEDDVILGNAGLKDQNLALRWVNENIASFGGNPQDVTIFGESAGGVSVGYHIISPQSRNLFKGAIMESGSAVSNLQQSNARLFAVNLANRIDSSITNSSTSEQIRDVLQAASIDLVRNLTTGMVLPVIEVNSSLSFLTTPLYETLESGDIARVPIIIGYNSLERIGQGNDTSAAVQQASLYDSNLELLVPPMNLKENSSKQEIGQLIHDQYVGKDGLFSENLAAYFELTSDNFMGKSCEKHAALQSKFSPVYMYQFSFYGTLSKGNLIIPGAGKVGHAQEVGYLFNVSSSLIETDADYLTRKRFVKLWTNFAKTSNPTPNDDSAELLENVKWVPLTEDNVQYLDIDETLEMKPNKKVGENALWNYIWETYTYRPYNTF